MRRSRARRRRSCAWLSCASPSCASLSCSVAVVAAHPDDEVLGLGGRLAGLGALTLVHLTDGAPRDMSDASNAGFATRGAYARARALELDRALAAAGAAPELAVEAAAARLARTLGRAPRRLEFACYHAAGQIVSRSVFWTDPARPETVFELDSAQRDRKRAALADFASQRAVLAGFPVEVERLRSAPDYDFTRPPPPGAALYDRFGWAIESAQWRCEAARALAALELG